MPKVTICGGGNAAHVLIAVANQAGWDVDVFAPLSDEAERLQAGIVAGGLTAHFKDRAVTGRVRRVSARAEQVVPGSDVVLLALPAFAHASMLRAVADCLESGAAVGAVPARGGFDYEGRSILTGRYVLFGLQTLPWACRIVSYGQAADVLGTKASVDLASLPAGQAPDLTRRLASLFATGLNPISSFLTLTLANTGQLIHPGIMYGLCRGREKATFSQQDIPLFYQGVDQATARLLQAMSDEVQRIAAAVAAETSTVEAGEVFPLYRWLLRAYPNDILDGSTLQNTFITNQAYTGLRVPVRPAGPDAFTVDFSARYLAEDVPYGLVVVRGIAELAAVATPALDEVIDWAQAMLGRRYLVNGALTGPDLAETRAPQRYGIGRLAQLVEVSNNNFNL